MDLCIGNSTSVTETCDPFFDLLFTRTNPDFNKHSVDFHWVNLIRILEFDRTIHFFVSAIISLTFCDHSDFG